MKNLIVVTVIISMISAETFAKKKVCMSCEIANGTKAGNQIGSQISKDGQKDQGVQSTEYDSLRDSAKDNVNNSQKGQATAYLLMGGLAAAAAIKFGMCSGQNYAACVAGAILMAMAMQAKESGQSFNPVINDSINSFCEYSNTSSNCGVTNPYTPVVASTPSISNAPNVIASGTKILEGKGYSVDPNSGLVKTPDGKVIDPNNKASIESALGQEGAAALMNKLNEIKQEALAKVDQVKASPNIAGGFEGGGGGAGIGGEAGSGYGDDANASSSAAARAAAAAAKARKPAQVTGLSKNFNGDPIGVAADSIFSMMSRRYQLKNHQKTFFGPEMQ